jgi:hypothetical protein
MLLGGGIVRILAALVGGFAVFQLTKAFGAGMSSKISKSLFA